MIIVFHSQIAHLISAQGYVKETVTEVHHFSSEFMQQDDSKPLPPWNINFQ